MTWRTDAVSALRDEGKGQPRWRNQCEQRDRGKNLASALGEQGLIYSSEMEGV